MSLPSSSLQSSQMLLDPRWGTWVLFYSCVYLVAWDCILVRKLGRDLGYGVRSRKLVTWCFEGVKRRKC